MIAAPITPIPQPQGGFDEQELMDFGAALTITLPKNEKIKQMTVWLGDTGEPVEGYIGKPLYRHVKEWSKVKKKADILSKLQGLMYLRVLVCVASQAQVEDWATFQDSDAYLYAFDASKINIYKCPSRGSDFVDMERWNKYFDEDEEVDVSTALSKNNKINKGGVVSTTYASPVEITFTIAANEAKEKGDTQTHKRMMKVQEKANKIRDTQSEIDARRLRMKQQQKKINESMKNKGQKEWKWQSDKKKQPKANAEEKKEEPVPRRKKKAVAASKYDVRVRADSKTKATNTKVVYSSVSYPIGSEDVKYYEKGMIVHVWSEREKGWVNGVVLEVIRFVKTVKVKYEGKTQQFKIPNVEKIKLIQ
eukprot:172403_1